MPGSDSDLKISLTPGSVTAEVTPSSLTARAEVASAGESGRLVLLWYAIDPAWNAWRVLSDPSGPVARSRAQTKDNKLVVDRSVSNSWACTDPGHYRVEAYLDVVRVWEAEPGLDPPQMTLVRFPDLNLVLCAPERWPRWRGEAETPETRDAPEHPEGLTEGALFLPNDGPLAVYLRAVPGPRSGRGLNADVLAAVRRLSRDKQPRKMVETREDCSAAAQPGTLLVRAWRTSEGTAEIAFGQVPEADTTTPGDLICDVLISVGTLYTPLAPPAP